MAPWTAKASAKALPISCVPGVARDDKRIPKGFLPIVLVRDDEESGVETRVLVRVKDLQEPCMAALLEMAEEQFGSFTFSPTFEAPPPRRSFVGGSPEIDANELHHLDFIIGEELSQVLPQLHPLPQDSSKKDELELHQAFSTILQPLPVFHSSPVIRSRRPSLGTSTPPMEVRVK
ncbi:hypothetical protein C2845_PM07G13960 [Panicum miliaceum]|uniref:Uncharacterized protein n=1 Tax=Panicum miliaceum TaxID=4540 RepID=A0A3L6SPU9_PANMI|nr:hypothetical protein C2845_PM07G13960 [Panicum miliaceum]